MAVYTASGYAALLRGYPYQKTFLGVSNSRVTTGIRRIGLANSQTTPDDDVMWKTILLFFWQTWRFCCKFCAASRASLPLAPLQPNSELCKSKLIVFSQAWCNLCKSYPRLLSALQHPISLPIFSQSEFRASVHLKNLARQPTNQL